MAGEASGMKTEVQTASIQYKRNYRQTIRELRKLLQERELNWEVERTLREKQLTSVLRTLLLVESKLKREQKLILNKFKEKDLIINKQSSILTELLSNRYCKHCNNSFDTVISYEKGYITSQDSSSISLDSSNELYEAISDKDSELNHDFRNEMKYQQGSLKSYANRNNDIGWRSSSNLSQPTKNECSDEVNDVRDANFSPYSNEDNTSNDYDKYDSLSIVSSNDQISIISQQSKNSLEAEPSNKVDLVLNDDNDLDQTNNLSFSESNITVIHNTSKDKGLFLNKSTCHKISDAFHKNNFREPNFDEVELPDKWYISVSDHEDEQQKNEYRINPVLECVNEILLQNMKDVMNSPPKTPSCSRKKFNRNSSPMEERKEKHPVPEDSNELLDDCRSENDNYYETPIQKLPNFYETPKSIYNSYEKIDVGKKETSSNVSDTLGRHEQGAAISTSLDKKSIMKHKILRTPPTPPPKPSYLVSRSYITSIPTKLTEKLKNRMNIESEPDYCSISEVNLPITPLKRTNFSRFHSLANDNQKSPSKVHNQEKNSPSSLRTENENGFGKLSIQLPHKIDNSPNKKYIEIPKLPLVTEIIIPEEASETDCDDKVVTQDNYIRNNTTLMKTINNRSNKLPVVIGTPVSSLIMTFNGRKSTSDFNENKLFSPFKHNSFENLTRQQNSKSKQNREKSFLDLQQNFEEFKLEESEIGTLNLVATNKKSPENVTEDSITKNRENVNKTNLKQCLESLHIHHTNRSSKEELQKSKPLNYIENKTDHHNIRSYEYFLECTGLSSKSISTSVKQ